MAARRMFSQKIIMSAKFLKMPLSSQALYFHLGLSADDDGIVEAFSIMRMVGSSEDDFRILISKQFIIQLNEEQVCFVTDWMEHNSIRADRKVNSIYQHLLLQTVDGIKLIEPRVRTDRQHMDNHGTSQGQPMDGIGKVRLGKDSIKQIKTIKEKPSAYASDINLVVEYFKERAERDVTLTKEIEKNLTAILKIHSLEDVKKVIVFILSSEWHVTNGHANLLAISRPTKFSEKLERAKSMPDTRCPGRISPEGEMQWYFEGMWSTWTGTKEYFLENFRVIPLGGK